MTEETKKQTLVRLFYLQDKGNNQYWVYPKPYYWKVTQDQVERLQNHHGVTIETATSDKVEASPVRTFISGFITRDKFKHESKPIQIKRIWNPGKLQLKAWYYWKQIDYKKWLSKKKKQAKKAGQNK